MAVPTSFSDLSTTPGSNYPAGSDNVFPNLDDALRALSAFIASIYANTATNGWVSPYATAASPTFTGVASFPDGSASAPSITNTGDTNTGICFPSADTVGVTVGATQKVEVGTTVKLGATGFIHHTDDGRLYGTALHNNAGAVTGTTNQYVASGTYTPTLTNVQGNYTSLTANVAQWMRVGNVVTVSGSFAAQWDSTTAVKIVGISLPIASDFTQTYQCSGLATTSPGLKSSSATDAHAISADATNNRAQATGYLDGSYSGSGEGLCYQFTYVVV